MTIQPAFGLNKSELTHVLSHSNEKAFRINQLLEWIFEHRESSLDRMTNLPKTFRHLLKEQLSFHMPDILSCLNAADGATKLLLKTPGEIGAYESVILRYAERTSLCVSSQVGCKLACNFCQTGKLGFFRHLSTHEIVSQFLTAQHILKPEGRAITHIVFMGMGEPLDNYDAVVKSLNLFIEEYGLSARKVTVSTSGIVPKIYELAKDTRAALAISLHACRDELRSELMPINRKYPLAELKKALTYYQEHTQAMLTMEYILLKDKNCGPKEAKELVKFLHGLKAKVNLIPFNTHPGMDYQSPDSTDVRVFQEYLSLRGYPAPVRYSKGLEVSAACGQLAAKNQAHLAAIPSRKSVTQAAMAPH